MEVFGFWLGGSVANALMGEGFRYLLQKMGDKIGDKFKQTLKMAIYIIAKEIESRYPREYEKLRSRKVLRKLCGALQSPGIDEEKFVSVLKEEGINEELARKLFKKVQLQYLKILNEEGLKHDQVFRGIILDRTKRIGKQQLEIQEEIDRIFDDISKRFHLLEKKIDELHDLTQEIRDRVESIPQIAHQVDFLVSCMRARLVSESPFRHDLDEILVKLLQAPVIERKVSDEDKKMLAGIVKGFQNWWKYVEHLPEMHPRRRRETFAELRRVSEALGETKEEVHLRLLLSLLSNNYAEMEELSGIVDEKADPMIRRLLVLSKQALATHMSHEGKAQEATDVLDQIEVLISDAWRAEFLLFKAYLIFQKGYSKASIKELEKVANELLSCQKDEDTAFAAILIADILGFFGMTDEAKDVLEAFKCTEFFPDIVKFHEALDYGRVRKFDVARSLFREVTVSSKRKAVREAAHLNLILIESLEDPLKALTTLDQFIQDHKPTYLVDFLLLKYLILSQNRMDRKAEATSKIILEIVKDHKESIRHLYIKKLVLLQRCYFLSREEKFAEVDRIIEEIEKLPTVPFLEASLAQLKASKAIRDKNLDYARTVLENLMEECSEARLKLKYLTSYIPLAFQTNEEDRVERIINDILSKNDIPWMARAHSYLLLGYIHHRRKAAEALKFYEKAEQIIAEEKNEWAFIMEVGRHNYNSFLANMHQVRLAIAKMHMEEFDFAAAWSLMETFPRFLRYSVHYARKGMMRQKFADLAVEGCFLRLTILKKYGRHRQAVNEIEGMLKHELTRDQKGYLLLLKSDFEMEYDLQKAQSDLKEALEHVQGDWIKKVVTIRKMKFSYLKGEFSGIGSVNDEIDKLPGVEAKLAVLANLGLFFSKEGAYPISVSLFKKGLELTTEKDSRYRRFSLYLAEAYSHIQPEKALKILDGLEKDYKGTHELILIRMERAFVLLNLNMLDDCELILNKIEIEDLNEAELHGFHRLKYRIQMTRKKWEQAILAINKGLKLTKASHRRNELLLAKARCAIEVANALMASEVLSNVELEELNEKQKEAFYVLQQRALILNNRSKDAFNLFLSTLPLFSSKVRAFLVQDSMKSYSDKNLQLEVLSEGFKFARNERLDTLVTTRYLGLMKEIVEKIEKEDVENNLDLMFLYGYALYSQDPEKAKAILSECMKRGFSPLYLVYYALSNTYGALGDTNQQFLSMRKAYELNSEDPWIISEHVGRLISDGQYELAEKTVKQLLKSMLFQVAQPTHYQLMLLLISKKDYESAAVELERWTAFSPRDTLALSALAAVYFLMNKMEQCRKVYKENLKTETKSEIAKHLADQVGKALGESACASQEPKESEKFEAVMKREAKAIRKILRQIYVELPLSKSESSYKREEGNKKRK